MEVTSAAAKPRVLYLLGQYPQLSETYIETELLAVREKFEVAIISMTQVGGATTSYKNHLPYRVIGDFPVVDYQRFQTRAENGPAIMNTGACIPQKRMVDFFWLARQMPDQQFNIYPVSYQVERISKLNQRMGSPVLLSEPVEPDDMPALYKKHRWLVYTACPIHNSVG